MEERGFESNQPTLPSSFSVRFIGFDRDSVNNIKAYLIPAVSDFSSHFPLSRLEGITVSSNFAEGLAEVQGTLVSDPDRLKPTDSFDGQGVAMAIPLCRSGELKTHIVFGPAFTGAMSHPEPVKAKALTESLLYHELAHATEYEIRYLALGESMMSSSLDCFSPLEYYLWKLSNHAWDEYFACRIEKLITGTPSNKDELFFSSLRRLRTNSRKYRVQYHLGLISGVELHRLVGEDTKLFITSLAYVLGDNDGLHSHGISKSKAYSLVQQDEYRVLHAFHEVLLVLWSIKGKWESVRDVLTLSSPTVSLLTKLGLTPFQGEGKDNDVYFRVDLSPEW